MQRARQRQRETKERNDPRAQNGSPARPENEDSFDDIQMKKAIEMLREKLK